MKSFIAAALLLFSLPNVYAGFVYSNLVTGRDTEANDCFEGFTGYWRARSSFMISHYSYETSTSVCYYHVGYLAPGESQIILLRGIEGYSYGDLSRFHAPDYNRHATRGPTSLTVAADCDLSFDVDLYKRVDFQERTGGLQRSGFSKVTASAFGRFSSASVRVTRPRAVSPADFYCSRR